MQIPSVYQAGYAKACALNPDLAAAYVGQTVVGDPEADAVVEALAPFSQREVHRLINAGMERDAELLAGAPPPLQAFFAWIETPPAWFDPASVHAGRRSTGRCGSTMVSDILNLHPRVLSLSEFFSFVGLGAFRRRYRTGDRMWAFYSRQQPRTRLMLRERYEELRYPVDDPRARFTRQDVPPILCGTLPHLTDAYEALFDELEPVVRGQPRHRPKHTSGISSHGCVGVWAARSGWNVRAVRCCSGPSCCARFPRHGWFTCTAMGGRRPFP